MSRPAIDSWEQHAWIGAGVGGGLSPRGALAGLVEGWYSVGGIALGARAAGTGQISGKQRNDRALLAGLRTPGNHWFFLTAVGISRLSASRTCGDVQCFPQENRHLMAPAYSIEAHGNLSHFGIGATMFGALGSDGINYHALALTLDAGLFGR
jgi:hypothetical protein